MKRIRISGVIGDPWDGLTHEALGKQLDGYTGPLEIDLHSPGGIAYEGVAIFNLLRPYQPLVRVTGVAASAASVIAMAGREIVMHTGAEMMIHDAWGGVIGSSADFRAYADHLDKLSESIADIYASRGVDRAQVRDAMRAETWYTADEAVAFGLATGTDKKAAEELDESARAVLMAMGSRHAKAPAAAVDQAERRLRKLAALKRALQLQRLRG